MIRSIIFQRSKAVGKTLRIDDAIGRYVVYVKNTYPKDF